MTVYDKDSEQRISDLNRELAPFYLVNYYDGNFSLCAMISELGEEYGQAAFDAYAVERGEDPRDKQGYIVYGLGHDWEAAFAEAFKDDPNISRICFDCESSGFFCNCDDLEILADFGKRFKALCLDTEKFTPIVLAGMKNAAEQARIMETVRGQLLTNPTATFDIMSPMGEIRVTPDMTEKLLAGEMPTVQIGGVQYADYELLDQLMISKQIDLFDENLIRLKTGDIQAMIFGEMKM